MGRLLQKIYSNIESPLILTVGLMPSVCLSHYVVSSQKGTDSSHKFSKIDRPRKINIRPAEERLHRSDLSANSQGNYWRVGETPQLCQQFHPAQRGHFFADD